MSAIKVPVQLVVSGAQALKQALGPLTDKAAATKLARQQQQAAAKQSRALLAAARKTSKAELAAESRTLLASLAATQLKARRELSAEQRSAAAKLAVKQAASRASLREKQATARAELSHDNAVARIELAQRLRNTRGLDAQSSAAIKAEQRLQQAKARADLSQSQATARNRLAQLQAATVAERNTISRNAAAALVRNQQAVARSVRAQQQALRAAQEDAGKPGIFGRAGAIAGAAFSTNFRRTAGAAFTGITHAASRILPRGFQAAGLAAARSFKFGLGGALVGGAIGVTALATAAIKRTLSGGLRRLVAIQDAETLFKGLGASAKTTNDILGRTFEVVNGTRFAFDEAAKTAAGLFAAGVQGGAHMERTLRLVSSAATVSSTDYITMGKIFQKVAADNRVQQRELGQLGEHGINITKALGQELGVTKDKVRQMASDGKISFGEFERGMKRALVNAAEEGKNSVRGLAKNVGTQFDKIGAAFLKPGFKQAPRILKDVTAGLKTLIKPAGSLGKAVFGKDFLPTKNIQGFFANIREGIPKLKNFIGQVKSFGTKFIKSVDWKSVGKNVGKFADGLANLAGVDLEDVAGSAKRLADSLETIAGTLGAVGKVVETLNKLDPSKSWDQLPKQNPFVTGPIDPAVGRTGKPRKKGGAAVVDTKGQEAAARIAGVAIGTAMMAGATAGITVSAPTANFAAVSAFAGTVSAVKTLLGIHSPSTVFMAIGSDVVQGFSNGFQSMWATASAFISSAFATLVATAKTTLAPIGTALSSGFNTAKTAVTTAVGGIVTSAGTKLTALGGTAKGAAAKAGTAIAGGFNAAKSAVGGAVGKVVSSARARIAPMAGQLGSVASKAASAVSSRLRAGASAAGAAASRVASGARSRLAPMAGQLGSVASKAASAVGSKLSSGASKARSAASSIASRAKSAINKMPGQFHGIGGDAGSGMARGIASKIASVAAAAARLVARAIAAARHKQQSASPSKVYAGIGKDAGDGYAIGIASTTKAVTTASANVVAAGVKKATTTLVSRAKTLRTELARAQARVETLADARSGFTSTFTGTIDRLTSFTDKKTPESIVTFLGKSLDKAREFTTVMTQLRQKGLSDAAFQQLAEAGADAGLAAANAISSGGPGVIKSVNNLLAGITKESNAFGNTAAKSLFDAGQQAANGMVKGLLTRQNALLAAAKKISKKMVAAVRSALGINSPSRVMADRVGKHIFPGAVQGAEATLPEVTKDFKRMALSIIPPNPAVAARNAGGTAAAQPAAVRPVNVKVEQKFYGPTTGAERVRDLDWTLRYGTAPALDDLTGAAA